MSIFNCFSFYKTFSKACCTSRLLRPRVLFTVRRMDTFPGAPSPVVGILSIGEMGLGVAKLLRANDYVVATCRAGRSKHTHERIKAADIKAYDSDHDLVAESDIILAIVPPRDAVATAKRVLEASRNHDTIKRRKLRASLSPHGSIVYVDLNAISPTTTRNIDALFKESSEPPASSVPRRLSLSRALSFRHNNNGDSTDPPPNPIPISFLDGGIIGPPPSPPASSSSQTTSDSTTSSWTLPSLVISGPDASKLLPSTFMLTLNMQVLDDKIGTASTLKSCFASLTKGMTALCILSFTTAHTAHVLPQLKSHLEKYSPESLKRAEGGLKSMPPKAYRWVEEMRQIGSTFATEGGMESGETLFNSVGEIYRTVAEDTVLGEERTEHRKRGRTADDVAECMREGIKRKKEKGEDKEKLELAWRGSWS